MKTLFVYLLVLSASCANGQEQFDLVMYQPPLGWERSSQENTVTFSKEDGSGNYCVMTVYKSIETVNDADANFSIGWESLVQNVLGTGEAIMQPGSRDKDWETRIGSAPYEKEGIRGAAILITSSKGKRMVNILILTNNDIYQKEMERFLEDMTLLGEYTMEEVSPANPEIPKYEVWMTYKSNVIKGSNSASFFVKLDNGKCIDLIPDEGLLNFQDNPKFDSFTWGEVLDKGREMHLMFPGYERKLGIVSNTKMSYPPRDKVTFYYRSVPVDGLRLDGSYSSSGPNWKSNPNARAIVFYKDGRFENKGGFIGMKSTNTGYQNRNVGNGSYMIKDFTLVLTYDDGDIYQKALVGLKDVDPHKDNSVLFFGEVPFFKH
ncbi:hypothetical protein [Flagellimonas amoyensis]|uniref:hypothetical protein n=1 Tax=Flagellimonas amoyensis TaxID=2169401 RepID=UPI000D37EBB1|nr:hypothetical protein [Allomuricauda amoyensis]